MNKNTLLDGEDYFKLADEVEALLSNLSDEEKMAFLNSLVYRLARLLNIPPILLKVIMNTTVDKYEERYHEDNKS